MGCTVRRIGFQDVRPKFADLPQIQIDDQPSAVLQATMNFMPGEGFHGFATPEGKAMTQAHDHVGMVQGATITIRGFKGQRFEAKGGTP